MMGRHSTNSMPQDGGMIQRYRGLYGRSGVTLIELVIAMFIGSLLAIFLYQVVNDQNKFFKRTDEVTRLDQNLRFAAEFVGRSIEMAGYGTNGWSVSTAQVSAIKLIDAPGTAGDQLQLLYADPSRLGMLAWGSPPSCAADKFLFENEGASTWSAFYYDGVSQMLCFSYVDSTRLDSYLIDVTGYDIATDEVLIDTPAGNEPFDTLCPDEFPPDMLCSPAHWLTFYIDNGSFSGGTGTSDNPLLMVRESTSPLPDTGVTAVESDDFVLAENIEFIDIDVCMSGADCDASADWDDTFNEGLDTDDVRQIRINLWAASDKIADHKSAYEHPLTGTADGLFRRMTSTNVMVRNMRKLADYNND